MAKKTDRSVGEEIELRRWCVEQAMRWPMTPPPSAVYGQQGGVFPSSMGQVEHDVISRAKRLLDWVNGR